MSNYKTTMNPMILDAASKFVSSLDRQPYQECVHIFASVMATMFELDKGDIEPGVFALDVYKDLTRLKEEK